MSARWTVNRPKPGPEWPAAHHQSRVFSMHDPVAVESTCIAQLLKSGVVSVAEGGGGKLNAIIGG